MIADLHAHYPMHLVPDADGGPLDLLASARGRKRLRDRIRALIVGLAGRFANYRSLESGPRVTLPLLEEGGVGLVCSVLYSFFDELDLGEPYGAAPRSGYLETLIRQLDEVEAEILREHGDLAVVARTPAELDRALEARKIAFVHCVEGGFHLGATPTEVARGVDELARRGVVYVTLAHLLWRQVATNAPALPFLPDRLYGLLFPQPKQGLSELGRAAVGAMVARGVLVDVSHMSERALNETFDLLDELDPGNRVPVIASHAGYRFGGQEYNLARRTVERIAARDGAIGLIFAQHQLNDGLRRRRTHEFEESFEVIAAHLERIREITGSHRHSAIGSDFDGFIKPTLGGLESMADMRRLETALLQRYGEDAEAIASGNALRVLRSGWRVA